MAIDFKRLSILLVEDNAVIRDVVSAVFDALDIGQTIYAKDGESGYERFCETKSDIIISDWEMSPSDGMDLLRKIRRAPNSPNKMVPVIFLTGYAAPERIRLARDEGVTEFLTKPFTADKLVQRLVYVINNPRDFVEAPSYTGPDRRRQRGMDFTGPYRRKTDF